MEFKLTKDAQGDFARTEINRIIMEFKFMTYGIQNGLTAKINRIIMEFKFDFATIADTFAVGN